MKKHILSRLSINFQTSKDRKACREYASPTQMTHGCILGARESWALKARDTEIKSMRSKMYSSKPAPSPSHERGGGGAERKLRSRN